MAEMDLWVTERYKNAGLTFKVKDTLFHQQSDFQMVDIVETETYGRMLLLDGVVMTTERDEFVYHEMISHIPLNSHPNPKSVLIIGGGDGGTLREVLKHPSVERVVMCEIDELVISSSCEYLPTIASALKQYYKKNDPAITVMVGDGIEYIHTTDETFDVILVDSTDPETDGPGQVLFTDQFYSDCLNHLNEGGILTAQTNSPISAPMTFRSLYQRFQSIFPLAVPYLATVPTYPAGLWSWSFCSKNGNGPFAHLSDERAVEIEQTCQQYNRALHRAAFTLPNFVRRMTLATTFDSSQA